MRSGLLGLYPFAAPSCLPSRENIVESKSNEKPSFGASNNSSIQRYSGRQNVLNVRLREPVEKPPNCILGLFFLLRVLPDSLSLNPLA